MDLRTIQRNAVDGYLKAVRVPVDVMTRNPGARLAVDRLDASVRDLFGRALGNAGLRDDARRRRVAVDERERAQRLKAEAASASSAADQEMAARQQAADDRRDQAERTASQQEAQAEVERQAEQRRIAETGDRQRAAIREAAAATEESIDGKAARTRLDQLDREAEALAEKEKALAASDEALRLAKATEALKADRKSS